MNLKEKLAAGRIFLDGGTGTVLQAQGLGAGEKPERWNILHPERIAALHRGYFEQGSDIAVSNTFGANRLTYPHGGEFEPQDIVTAGVNILRDTADAFYAETGRRETSYSRFTSGRISAGPRPQFKPKAVTPIACRIAAMTSGVEPERSRPCPL